MHSVIRIGSAWRVVLCLPAAGLQPVGAVPVTALAFAPDGSALVSNGDRCLVVRSPINAATQSKVVCDLPKITSIAFAPGGKMLAVGGGEPGVRGEVRLLSWPAGKVLHRLTNHTDVVTQVAFDSVGSRLGVASADHTAHVWHLAEKSGPAIVFTLTGHAGPVLALAFSPSGQSLVTAGADRSLKVWSSGDGRLVRSSSHHTEAIQALAFRPRASAAEVAPVTCATGGDDRTVRLWQPEIGRMVRIVRHHDGPVFALAWSTNATALFSAGKEGIIRRIDASSDTIKNQWQAHDDWIYALAASPDGTTLASGDWSGSVRIHDLRAMEQEPVKEGRSP